MHKRSPALKTNKGYPKEMFVDKITLILFYIFVLLLFSDLNNVGTHQNINVLLSLLLKEKVDDLERGMR